jgi:hypothetical protein
VKALCCTCGSIRECRRARNHRPENYWLSGPINNDWWRETGDLKCAECNSITTHALLHPDGDKFRDHAEMMQRVATGNSHSNLTADELAVVRQKYRQGPPRNPELNHLWWMSDAQAAWDSGKRIVAGLCGAPMTIDRDPSSRESPARWEKSDDRQIEPKKVRDQEYEDPKTGMWWTEMDCVDCLRVWHLELLRQRREVLAASLTEFLADLLADNKGGYPKKVDLRSVNSLIEALETARHRTTAPSKDRTQ